MATLVNKINPAIRMTAPEIEVHEEEEMYFIPVSDYCIPMCIDDWTLVEEEYIENRNDGTYTCVTTKEEPVDLEEETKKWWKKHLGLEPEKQLWMDAHQSVVFARHFYELGKGGSK